MSSPLSSATRIGPRFIALLLEQIPGANQKRIGEAVAFAEKVYGSACPELLPEMPLLDHALETSRFLAEFCKDDDAIIACILQHTLRVSGSSLHEVGTTFGRDVRDMVSRIHLLSHLYTTDWRKSIDDMKIMLVSVADDVRVLLIALSVASVYLSNLKSVRPEYRMRLCRQSLQLFAPVAARLGIYALKYRFEKAAFPETYPSDAQLISQQLKNLQAEHGAFLNRTSTALRDFLREEGIQAEVMAREKQPYSIFQKMHHKSVTALEKINDLFAIRVIVKTLPDCYQALGLLHRLATPLSHRFKDYISFPKPNGYQSLHTCLIGLPHAPNDVTVEVQIRTEDMHREAEYGVAAHWLYKSVGKGSGVIASAKQLQLADVLLKQHTVGSDDASASDTLTLVDHIYVLTPRGDIIELPEGSTPLDFAFALHSDLGLRFKAARVNGSIVPISHTLENGDIVEVVAHKYPQPALQWLESLVTSSARAKLKAYFFSHNRPQFLSKGREMVNAELKTRGHSPLDNELTILSLQDGHTISVSDREDLLVKVGMGSIRTSSILRHISARPVHQSQKTKKKAADPAAPLGAQVGIEGQPLTMPYRFAKCCNANMSEKRHDHLIGIVTRAGVISVHKDTCHVVKSGNPERRLKMFWS